MVVESAGERYRRTPEARGERGGSSGGGSSDLTTQDYRYALAHALLEAEAGEELWMVDKTAAPPQRFLDFADEYAHRLKVTGRSR